MILPNDDTDPDDFNILGTDPDFDPDDEENEDPEDEEGEEDEYL